MIEELVRLIEWSGTKEIAELYLKCGEDGLQKAAKTWAKSHGYAISENPIPNGQVQWRSVSQANRNKKWLSALLSRTRA